MLFWGSFLSICFVKRFEALLCKNLYHSQRSTGATVLLSTEVCSLDPMVIFMFLRFLHEWINSKQSPYIRICVVLVHKRFRQQLSLVVSALRTTVSVIMTSRR